MKVGWETKTLGELCGFQRGLTYAKGDEVESSSNIVLRANNIDLVSSLLDFAELKYISDSIAVPVSKKIRKDSLMICTASGSKSHLGRLHTSTMIMVMHLEGSWGCCTPKGDLVPRYLFHLITSTAYKEFIGRLSDGANINNLKFDDLSKFRVPFPPLPEQQRIVGILDEAFDGIAIARANTEKNLQNARALFESHLQSIFTKRSDRWADKPLAELCDPTRVITYGVIKLGEEVSSGVPCLRTSNVRWLRIDTDGMKRIAPSLSEQFARTILRGGEVLVNVRGTLGGVSVAAPEMTGWNVSREVAVVPVDPSRINPEYLTYWIGAGMSQQWLGDVKKGAAYIGINIEDLRMLPVKAPGFDEQSAIVRHLNDCHEKTLRLESIYQQKLAALDALKKSLLHQAFTGQL